MITLYSTLIVHLWQSTLFAAVAGLLTLLLKRNQARTRYWVWLAALVKFLIPFGVLVSLGGHLGAPRWTPKASAIMEPTISFVMGDVGQSTLTTALAAPQPTNDRLPALLFGVWAFGFLVILSRWLLRWMQVRADVRAGSRLSIEVGIPVVSSPVLREPGVFGILRPVLLLPKGMAEHLSKAEREAILAHELCHARCYDNLTAAIYMLVETIFWFHPLVWWIGKRLVAERERACDEEVLRLGSEPKVYAEGILKVCELYLESPLECVAGVTGSNLRRRIHAIMTHRGTERMKMGKKLALAVAGTVALAVPIGIGIMNSPVLLAQSPQVSAFEVASVRVLQGGPPDSFFLGLRRSGGRISWTTNLGLLLRYAYNLPDWRIVRTDKDQSFYAIDATMDTSATEDQVRLMLQTLLADRFKLVSHREAREVQGYALALAKNGPKIKSSLPGELHPMPEYAAGKPPDPFEGRVFVSMEGKGTSALTGRGVSTAQLAETLSATLGTLVLDQTGMTGNYYFGFKFLSVQNNPSDEVEGSTIFSALQDELGLKLEKQKGPIEVLVIDHVERPSEN